MATKIYVNHILKPAILTLPFNTFFCKEDTFDVLKKLVHEHNISKYKHLSSRFSHFSSAEINRSDLKNPRNKSESTLDLNYPKTAVPIDYNLSLEEINTSKLDLSHTIDKSIDDFDISFLKNPQKPFYLENPEDFIGNFIRTYLIRLDTTNYKSTRDINLPIVRKINNYLIDRKEKKNLLLETKLEEIVEFASALYKTPIDMDFLEKIPLNLPKLGSQILSFH